MFLNRMFKKKDNKIDHNNLPSHIAIIMDGNGRWAKKRGLPRSLGHKEGANVLKRISGFCDDIGIKYLTVYAFSTENWKRPKKEVDTLMSLLLDYLKNIENHLQGRRIRVQFIGDLKVLDSEILKEIDRVIKVTSKNTGLTLYIALNYGGRDEIIHAVKNIAKDICEKKYSLNNITEDLITQNIYTKNVIDPDLLIRPGGEKRLSNFLTWQCAYTELWYTDILWPDFKNEDLIEAIFEYQKRNRRFGGI